MKLLVSSASPYARKCQITAREKNIDDVQEVFVHPIDDPNKLNHLNPLGKIPCLVYGDDQTLFDSPVICAYFDEIGTGPALTPLEGNAKWETKRREAMADGMLDSALSLVYEFRKPEEKHYDMWIERWTNAINRALAQFEKEVTGFSNTVTTDKIALATAIDYIKFRLDKKDWFSACPKLMAWQTEFAKRQSMQQTQPK